MRAFVTGGTGLLGSNLVRILAERGWQVKALARSARKAGQTLGGLEVQVVEGDMTNLKPWAHVLKECDVLFHTAAYFRETFRKGDHWDSLERINVTQTVKLFELAHAFGVKKMVHTSTAAAIRKRKDGKISDENDRIEPEEALNLYGKSKVLGDLAIARLIETSKLPIVTVHPAWMFGPGDAAPTGSGRLVLNCLARKLPGSFPSGIDVVDARDAAEGMIQAAALGSAGERYILSASHLDLEEIIRLIGQESGVPAPTRRFPLPMVYLSTWINERLSALRSGGESSLSMSELRVMTERKLTSGAKAVRELNVSYRPFESTIRDTVAWFMTNGTDAVRH